MFVPRLQVGGLSLSIGLAAMGNAGMLLAGLLRRGSYQPARGWLRFALQVLAATLLMLAFLLWADEQLAWLAGMNRLHRIVQFTWVIAVAAVLYFGALAVGGFRVRTLLRR